MVSNNKLDSFRKYILKVDDINNHSILIRKDLLDLKVKEILLESIKDQQEKFYEFLLVEFEKSEYDLDMSHYQPKSGVEKEFNKLKKKFLFDMKSNMKKILRKK